LIRSSLRHAWTAVARSECPAEIVPDRLRNRLKIFLPFLSAPK